MCNFLKPHLFDLVVKAALQCAILSYDDEEDLKHPNVAIKLGFDIARLAYAKLSTAMKTADSVKKQDSSEFLNLLNMEWADKVDRSARLMLAERKFNKKNPLPLPQDLKTLAEYMKDQLQTMDYTNYDAGTFRRVAILVEGRLLTYNKRRPG